MNMNKSDKILAARKRLKEFQKSKKGNVTNEEVDKYGNDDKEDKEYRQTIVVDRKDESEILQSRESSPAIKIPQTVIQAPSESSELIIDGENETEREDLENPSRYFQDTVDNAGDFRRVNDLAEDKSDSLNLKNDLFDLKVNNEADIGPIQDGFDVFEKKEIGKEDLRTDIIPSVNNYGSLAGSQTLQKEYLLQMSSALANVLTNDKETGILVEEFNTRDLEERNQFLASRLEDEKDIVNRLNIEVSKYKTRIVELEATLATKDVEFESKLHRELNPLKEQLHLHAQTTGILVGEKAELTAALLQSQTTAKQKVAEVEELNGRLKSMQIQLSEMERELNYLKNSTDDAGKANHKLQSSYDTLENKYSQLKLERDDLELETSELRQKLNVKNTEITNIEQELKEKTALLSLNELRIQQMTSSPQGNQGIGEQHHVVAALEQQLSQLMETLKSVSSERDEASSHYQNYVHQLNAQVTGLALKLEETTKENAELKSRENSLIKRLSELEKQIQSKNEIPEPQPATVFNDTSKERIDELEKSIDELKIERDSLRDSLNEKELIIESIKRETEELQEIRSSNAEASRLASALEGERLAAARAVSQNQQLKQQLSEMQDAFVQLSNAKLDLTEQLQGERAIGRKLNARLNDTENDVYKLKEDILSKDSIIAEFEKEKLHAAQIADQMQHYQAQSQHAGTLEKELNNAKEEIEHLKKENKKLEELVKKSSESLADRRDNHPDLNLNKANDTASRSVDVVVSDKNIESSNAVTQTELEDDGNFGQDKTETITPEAVKKLEERFKDTMERLAELSDEKQRLEHLVLQLQSETETIGEYVTLYQKQRGVLQERAKEKEEAFRQLTEQRNQQQEQLHKLKMLVAELIREKNNPSKISTTGENEIRNDEANGIGQEHIVSSDNKIEQSPSLIKDKTTSKILDLLTEIKECKETCALEPNFHPCPWCSGKLITV